jgi:hypothetical protein
MSYLDYLASGLRPLSLIQSLIENSFFSWTDLIMYLPHFDVTIGAVSISGIFSLFKYRMMDKVQKLKQSRV